MIKDFLYQKCTITNKSVSISGGEETPTITTIYTNIPCMIYSGNVTYKNTPLSKQTSATDMRCIIEGTKTLIRDKMDISITDDATGLVGEYTISGVRPLRLKGGKINHIEFDLNDKFLTR